MIYSFIYLGLVIAGYDDHLGYQIYKTSIDGSFESWNAIAIGQNTQNIINDLENQFIHENIYNNHNILYTCKILIFSILMKHFTDKYINTNDNIKQSITKVNINNNYKLIDILNNINESEWDFEVKLYII